MPNQMTAAAFRAWLAAHAYGRGRLLAFVADANAILAAYGGEPTTLCAVQHWLHDVARNGKPRGTPQRVGGIEFEQLLELIIEQRGQPAPVAIYTVHFALNERENKVLLRTARRAHLTMEQFLGLCLRIGFEDQTGLDEKQNEIRDMDI